MLAPNAHLAEVPPSKILDYLLSTEHRTGRGKARFFHAMGFRREDWKTLAEALKQHVVEHHVAGTTASNFGTRYRVEGGLQTPIGKAPQVRSVWPYRLASSCRGW